MFKDRFLVMRDVEGFAIASEAQQRRNRERALLAALARGSTIRRWRTSSGFPSTP